MKAEFWNLLVPGLLFLVWLLNQVFSKEANAGPPRTTGLGPRPGGLPPAPRPRRDDLTARPSDLPSGLDRPDDVFVIRSGMTAPKRPPARGGPGRRGQRGE